jgi:hypothetical protein
MSWAIHDEFVDFGNFRHTVIFKNRDTGAEHHLIHEFKLHSCPHCGVVKTQPNGEPIDFALLKAETLAALQAHHKTVLQYGEKHVNIRRGSERKK